MKKIAILASGSGTNAQNIIEYFREKRTALVSLVLSNSKDAYVLKRAEKLEVPYTVFGRKDFYESDRILNILEEHRTDLIVLAGFLWLIPQNILKAYPDRIVNIHPALLPKYGGKGMYGNKVHKAVLEKGEKESGISIHYVNEKYDEGEVIFQAKCPVKEADTPESLASRVHELEYRYYPEIINKIILEMDS
ncbi:MAG: phosphoribosylglycinamide formyltransferase [Bacteroidales bacterium]|nr:phosphoribosylglycinamide formyltransferase [Bacteroidales bacterium]MCF8399306.1 phosphoribosylglycinamide formyltransferase [Bacteroidales bacterium]